MSKEFQIDVRYNQELDRYIGTSDGIRGLAIEESSMDGLIGACKDIVPILLADDPNMTKEEVSTTKVQFVLNIPLEQFDNLSEFFG